MKMGRSRFASHPVGSAAAPEHWSLALRLPSGRLRCRSGTLVARATPPIRSAPLPLRSRTRAGDRATARAARPVAGSGAVERQAQLIGQGRQPREDVADLVELLVARALAHGSGQLAELLGEPGDRRVDAPAAVTRPEVRAISSWNSSSCITAVWRGPGSAARP